MSCSDIDKILQQKFKDRHPKILAADCTKAAVSIILRQSDDTKDATYPVDVLLMQRAYHDADPWSGQISFPGGRLEDVDSSMRATAERETEEEMGVQLQPKDYIGQLDDVLAPVVTNKKSVHISSFVYQLNVKPHVSPNHEVAQVIWMPLDYLFDLNRGVKFDHPTTDGTVVKGIRLDEVGRDGEPLMLWGLSLRLMQHLVEILELKVQ